jgi:hypothetical protein
MPSLLAVPVSSMFHNRAVDGTTDEVPADEPGMRSSLSPREAAQNVPDEEKSEPDNGTVDDDNETETMSDPHHPPKDLAPLEGVTAATPPSVSTITAATLTTTSTKPSKSLFSPATTGRHKKSKKRKVTPPDAPTSKKNQQKKSSDHQRNLAFFFGKPASPAAIQSTTKDNDSCGESTNAPSPGCVSSPNKDTKASGLYKEIDKDKTSTSGNRSNDEASKPTNDGHQPNRDIHAPGERSMTSLTVGTKLTANESETPHVCSLQTLPQASGAASLVCAAVETKKSSTTDNTLATATRVPKAKTSVGNSVCASKHTGVTVQTEVQPLSLLTEIDLSEDRRCLDGKFRAMRERYLKRASELVAEVRDGLEEERYETPALRGGFEPESAASEGGDGEQFSTQVVANMVVLVEGR